MTVDFMPTTVTDIQILEFFENEESDVVVGVQFDPRGKIYAYLAPKKAHVGSMVLVPGNWYCPDPQLTEVVTMEPPPYTGPLKRVLQVLS